MADALLAPFLAREDQTGFRTSWSTFVVDAQERANVAVPTSALYTPLKPLQEEQINPNNPVICHSCGSAFSIHNQIYASENRYTCRFCGTSSPLPQRMHGISDTNRPIDIKYQTLEYELKSMAPHPVSLIFVIDTCVSNEEVAALLQILNQLLNLIPSSFRLGLVTTGTANHIYDLSSTENISSFAFNSAKDYTNVEYCEMLGLNNISHTKNSGFLVPIGEGMLQLGAVLAQIARDPYEPTDDHRETRGTGSAISLALAVLEALDPDSPGRVMVFTGGPCTTGPGQVVSIEKKEKMRQRVNFEKETDLKYFDKATQYYTRLAQRAVNQGHAVDLFMAAQDQVGFAEMQSLVDLTGGYSVLSTAFSSNQFKLSLLNIFSRGDGQPEDLDMAFNCKIIVKATEYIKLTGIIGPCASLHDTAPYVHTVEIGKGGTCRWALPALTSQTTLCLNWEIALPESDTSFRRPPVIQILSTYNLPTGQHMLRTTTIDFRWNDSSKQLHDVIESFDYEAAAAIIARIACWRAEANRNDSICQTAVNWVDKTLIRLCRCFAVFQPSNPSTFSLPRKLLPLPQLIFSLRRSRLLRVFNHTPDETCFYRTALNRETVSNIIVMILPTLLSFSLDSPDPVPVLLDMTSVKKDVILLLDTYFRIIIHHGETIAYWREQGQHLLPQNAGLKALLEAPTREAGDILRDRFPVPHVLVCDQGSSQARFLDSQLNPSGGAIAQQQGPAAHTMIFSDDYTFKNFYERLKQAVIQKLA